MTANELRDIFLSTAFRQDLEEMSSYLASIMQERPIIHALAKYLWKQRRHKYQLEAKRKDLIVDGIHIEFKYNFDCGMGKLSEELGKHGERLKDMWAAVSAKMLSKSWPIMPKIYEDVCVRRPDIFVWIVCSRDLSAVDPEDRKRICWSKPQCKWNEYHPYSDQRHILVADTFLEKLKLERTFTVLRAEVETKGDFPSIYHFRICEFAK